MRSTLLASRRTVEFVGVNLKRCHGQRSQSEYMTREFASKSGASSQGSGLLRLGGWVVSAAGAATAAAVGLAAVGYDLRATQFYSTLADRVGTPLLCVLDAEDAHNLALQLLAMGLAPVDDTERPRLHTTVLGLPFRSPLGLAAGFDKQARVLLPFFGLGFGYVEVGGITPLPQPGNPKPRVFRLPEDQAIINRFGLNSEGAAAVAERLQAAGSKVPPGCVVGANLASNTVNVSNPAACAADCVSLVAQIGPWVDVLVLNVSCPNVGRASPAHGNDAERQAREQEMDSLVEAVVCARNALPAQDHKEGASGATPSRRPALLLKVSPDLDAAGRAHVASLWYRELICYFCSELFLYTSRGTFISPTHSFRPPNSNTFCFSRKNGAVGSVDGLVVANTTALRPESLQSAGEVVGEKGGLSGAPLKDTSTALLRDLYRYS